MKALDSTVTAGALALAVLAPGAANAAVEVLSEGEGRFAFRHVGFADTLTTWASIRSE